MEVTQCDFCGKVIDGYYPDIEIKGTDLYEHEISIPGKKKESINYLLEIDARHGNKPVKFKFCSMSCLRNGLDHIEDLIDG